MLLSLTLLVCDRDAEENSSHETLAVVCICFFVCKQPRNIGSCLQLTETTFVNRFAVSKCVFDSCFAGMTKHNICFFVCKQPRNIGSCLQLTETTFVNRFAVSKCVFDSCFAGMTKHNICFFVCKQPRNICYVSVSCCEKCVVSHIRYV